jgi:hypothetical protein
MASSNGLAENIATSCGGGGRPAAAVSHAVNRNGAPLSQPRDICATKKDVRRPPPLHLHLSALDQLAEMGECRRKAIARDDTSPMHWRDKFVDPAFEAGKSFKQTAIEKLDAVHAGRKRENSDASFGCRGVNEMGLDRYQVEETEQLSSKDEKSMTPDPLFSGKRGEKGSRDTLFYQPYVEVLDAY